MSRINVAITGALSVPRSKVAERINATSNGHFVEWVTFETHYLVCAKADSLKAKKAVRLGTAVISENELNEYLDAGCFPSTQLPEKPEYHHHNFPEIQWTHKADPEIWVMTYCDARGNTTVRKLIVMSTGFSIDRPDDKWIGGYDGPQFKTWRQDRIIEAEVVATAPTETLKR